MGTRLLVCVWVGLGVLVSGEGGGSTATGLPQSWARAPAPGSSSPGTASRAADTGVSSGPACAPWCCRPRRSSSLPTTSASLCTITSLERSKSAWWTPSTCPGDMSNVSSGSCVLTWGINPVLEPLASLLSYELAFKKQEEAWEWAQHKDHIIGVTWLILEAVELNPDSTYEARLRVQMATLEDEMAEEERYEGHWSEWSQPVCFPSPRRQDPQMSTLRQPNSTLVAVFIFLLLTSLTYLLFKLSPRVKRTFHQHVPTPAAFFQPLYSAHRGNFQTWTGTHRAGVQLNQDCVGTAQAASESSVRDAISLLTYDLVAPWPFVGLEDESTGTGLPADVLPTALEWAGPPPAYLPQEEWVPARPRRPAAPQSEGSSSDYCALSCYGGCDPSPFLGSIQSSGPIQALVYGIFCDQQSLEARQGDNYVGASHSQRRDPGEQAA
ncbi:interleukin-9 receptor isoform 2-T3 [Molossus nigricans]